MSEQMEAITRQELYEKIWKHPLKQIAEELGTNYIELVRVCENLNVPRPPQGHWHRLKLGLPIESVPLQEPDPDTPKEAVLGKKAKEKTTTRPVLKETQSPGKLAEPILSAKPAQPNPATAPKPTQSQDPSDSQASPATEAILNRIRQTSSIDFWADSLSWEFNQWSLASLLKLPKEHGRSMKSLLSEFMKVRKEYDSFTVETRTGVSRDPDSLQLSIRIKDGFEWRDVWEEAWKSTDVPSPHFLTDNAAKLLQWVRSEKNSREFTDQNKIGRQANLRGSYQEIADLFKEIQAKVKPRLVVEEEGWGGPFKAYFAEVQPRYFDIGPLNPPLGLSLREVEHGELMRFKRWLYAELQRIDFPRNNEFVGIFEVADRRIVKACFSDWPTGFSWDDKIREFFDSLRLMPGICIHCLFESGPGPWLVTCSLSEGWTWSRVKEWLREQQSMPPLRQRYGLSEHGAALLEWIVGLRPEEYLGRLTPVVEDHIELDIGVEMDWPEENIPAYLAFDLLLQSWQQHGNAETRIRVKHKPSEMDSLVRAIQLFGLSRNKMLDAEPIKAAVDALLSSC
ncbi:MAG: hypothetical protein DMG97_37180 [Acidobacteria bacterium]|nr:MAG: hypothetical protein DMG97_37180 [Acidobacteriota bacterium]